MRYTKYIALFWLMLAAAACQSDSLTANAGQDFTVSVDSAPAFDGCASTGEIVNYKWIISGAPSAMISDVGKVIRAVDVNCSFTLEANMGLDEVGEWVIDLEVRDPAGNTATDSVVVTVVQ